MESRKRPALKFHLLVRFLLQPVEKRLLTTKSRLPIVSTKNHSREG